MRRVSHGALSLLLAGGLAASAIGVAGAAQAAPAAPKGDILAQLKAIKGMSVQEKPSTLKGYRWFWLTYKQPVDHRKPHGKWFEQRIMLEHRDASAPMVEYTSGYNTPEAMFQSEPTALLNANQISVEYRYFTPSRPQDANWKYDNIWQAATDEHRIVQALKPIYGAKWINTGASKGGMTATYHKRFYPNDVAGSVVYVAPNDYNNNHDKAYDKFFQTVGTDPTCRAHVKDLAREILKRRTAMETRMNADAKANKWTFSILRTVDRAFENSVMDFEWGFWQYHLQSECASLPATNASDDDIYKVFNDVSDVSSYSDQSLGAFIPYYYQAGTQLGWPSPKFPNLHDLLRYESSYVPRTYVPRDIPMRFDNGKAMRDIDSWVRGSANHMLFLYGANDPWGSKPFRLGKGSRDSAVYVAPGMNHSGRLIAKLPDAQRAKAIADLQRWAGVAPSMKATFAVPTPMGEDPTLAQRPPL
ncbi:S28 family serine protease [Actinomadura rupiterrae]|uniref:S28 family serine protease n=1 Tax=Actinomadura rupiterrae TaxID=559627 RepID=UPI0020A35510|nr:S28 family serine protease [Actinomadura rupiterrae]MCP2341905.1 hypothetical protein [Actinomadura rupiterrae]